MRPQQFPRKAEAPPAGIAITLILGASVSIIAVGAIVFAVAAVSGLLRMMGQ